MIVRLRYAQVNALTKGSCLGAERGSRSPKTRNLSRTQSGRRWFAPLRSRSPRRRYRFRCSQPMTTADSRKSKDWPEIARRFQQLGQQQGLRYFDTTVHAGGLRMLNVHLCSPQGLWLYADKRLWNASPDPAPDEMPIHGIDAPALARMRSRFNALAKTSLAARR